MTNSQVIKETDLKEIVIAETTQLKEIMQAAKIKK